jgi:Tectonin domain
MHSRPVRLARALILVGLTVASGALAQTTSSWVAFGNRNAQDIAVGANGVVWIIGTDNNIFRWDGSAFQQQPGGAWRIAVDPNGKAWVVNHGNQIFRWNGSSWDLMPGAALDVGIGADGSVWVLGMNGSPYKWDGTNWRSIGGGATRIAVDPAGNPWVVNAIGQVWRFVSNNWELLPGNGKDIAVAPDGTVLLISTSAAPGGFQIQRWAAGQWIATDAGGTGVAAGPGGALYVMKDTGALVSRSGGAATPAPGAPAPVAGTAPPPVGDEGQLCWKKSFGRGVGTVPTQCSSGYEKDAGLCYSTCKAGYKGVGPVCWSSCPDGFRDDGAFCAKPAAYGRGSGYPWKFGDGLNDDGMRSRCEGDNGAGNCEKYGAMYYPKCKANFHAVECCICSPDCPSGTTDIGVSCAKASYGRGVGTVPSCGNLSYDAGLCYESCPRDFDGVGPICWGKCPSDFPFPCGAGCAVSETACAAAVTEMTVETVSVAATILSFPFGGPGAMAAARTGIKAATNVAKTGFKATLVGVKTAVKTNAKAFAKATVKSYLKSQVTDPKNIVSNIWTVAGKAGKKGTSLAATNQASREMGELKTEGQFDYTMLMSLDPTGFSSMIYSFAKYGSCSVEDLATNVGEVDFGPGPTAPTDVRTIELTVQNPTTITEITSSPFQGCSIIPNSDCAGKTLQPGQKCTVNVKVAGTGKIVGEVHVYTTAYDVIPLAIGVKANSAATSDCTFLADADDAVNLSSLAGVWAWKDDQSQKIVIKNDGTLTSPLGSGGVQVVDPVARTYMLGMGTVRSGASIAEAMAVAPAQVTLNPEHDRFTFNSGPNGGTSAVRRPWDSRCKPGEQFYAGLCYDIPVGYEITVPGFVGKPCPSGWRDDGVQCYPIWTGPKVAYQADTDGSLPMRRPILVTDCPTFSPVQGNQACPVNFKKVVCTCEAQPTGKDVKSLIGKIPGT